MMICRKVEVRDSITDKLKATLISGPGLWERISIFNGGLSVEQVRKALDAGLSVWTSFSRYAPIREEISAAQAAWETATGMRGYPGSPAQRENHAAGRA